ncbi:MAG: hypothetical protein DI585_01410 [Pseudomonas fluorescens]|nr:MAG: hypothetical protein DI585_01410 [Pseudomonas fluorescens]
MSPQYYPPQQLIALYSPDDWEKFVEEWLFSLTASNGYSHVQKLAGSGDQGRDVVGHTVAQKFDEPWDNYQCKHYSNKLGPADLTEEACKHIFFAYKGEFVPARQYYFVAPLGVSTESAKLLGDANKFKARVIKEWDKMTASYKLIEAMSPALLTYIQNFDFSIFRSYTTIQIVSEHSKTPYHAQRFGNVPMPKLASQSAPLVIADNEVNYLRNILDAYEDKKGIKINNIDDLDVNEQRDVKENRDEFYNAEYFQTKSREIHPPEEYISLQDDIYHSVSSTLKGVYSHGVERLNKTLEKVIGADLGKANYLAGDLRPIHRKGICHQLANLSRILWSNKNYD